MLLLFCAVHMSDITNQPLLFFLPNLKFLLNTVLQAAMINYLELARKIEGHPRTKLDLIIVWTGVEKGQAQSGTRVNVSIVLSSFPCVGKWEEPRARLRQISPLLPRFSLQGSRWFLGLVTTQA